MRMKNMIIAGMLLFAGLLSAQTGEKENVYNNSAEKLLRTDGNLTIGGYGEIHYNQPLNSGEFNNGKLDVHRMVVLLGYRFNERTQFISEIEFEHVSEVYIEQAFLQYKINDYINFRGGLLLIPMGIINEYHEPTTFNGVERPLIDNKISPTTWREIGFGLSGAIIPVSVRYQAYLINGFNGYDGAARLNGKNGLRSGRQKGANSYINSPNFSGKVEYYGIRGLNVGLSAYFGNTQSTLYSGLDKNDEGLKASADSSLVGVSMLGIDGRYSVVGIQLRAQYYLTKLSNTSQYNNFTSNEGVPNDLGSSMTGFYLEAGYDVFSAVSSISSQLIPFVRLEGYNTHKTVEDGLVKNPAYNNAIITSGLTWKITPGAVIKTDLQFVKAESDTEFSKVFNAGIGVMF